MIWVQGSAKRIHKTGWVTHPDDSREEFNDRTKKESHSQCAVSIDKRGAVLQAVLFASQAVLFASLWATTMQIVAYNQDHYTFYDRSAHLH